MWFRTCRNNIVKVRDFRRCTAYRIKTADVEDTRTNNESRVRSVEAGVVSRSLCCSNRVKINGRVTQSLALPPCQNKGPFQYAFYFAFFDNQYPEQVVSHTIFNIE